MRRASKRYTCLSYCWGYILNSHLVLCNRKELRVHANLHDALIQLARRRDTQDYWIDAICINQTDLDEKRSQIQLMGQIFERAASVFVWLGKTSATENEDIMQSPNLEAPFQLLRQKDWAKIEIGDLVSRGLPPLDSLFWETMGNILNRSWFTRLWVIQEVTLCRNSFIILGCRAVPFFWFLIASFVLNIIYKMKQLPSNFGASQTETHHALEVVQLLCDIWDLQTYVLDEGTMSLSSRTHLLLAVLKKQEVSDAADRVHGMLAMFKHKFMKHVTTSANTTVAETYQSFAVASLLADRRLTLLHYVVPTSAVTGLPSWCPDLSCQADRYYFWDITGRSKFRSGIQKSRYRLTRRWHERLSTLIPLKITIRSLQATAQFLPASNTLLVKGIIIDKVARIVSNHPSWNSSSSSIAQIEGWEQECLRISQTTLKCPDSIPVAYVRTLIGDPRTNDYLQPEEVEPWDPRAPYISALEAIKTRDHPIQRGPVLTDLASQSISLMSEFSRERRFMATIGNRIGLCPPHTKQGDLICILWGARSPFVLRRMPDTENFQLVGECYVDGLMYGEAFRIKREQRLKDVMFPLI